MAMVNGKKLKRLLERLRKELGREPTIDDVRKVWK